MNNHSSHSHRLHSRRSALKTFGAGFLSASALGFMAGAQAREAKYANETPYKIFGWTGDDFRLGHRLRDKKFDSSTGKVEKKVDFVIVGGGISGLSLAHFLADHDYLLLEQYSELGGQARGELTEDTGFSYGSTWINSLEGALGQLLDALGLKTKQLESISTAWLWNNHWSDQRHNHGYDFASQDPIQLNEPTLAKSFAVLFESCGKQLSRIGQSFVFANALANSDDGVLWEMDKLTFNQVAQIEPRQLQTLLDNYFRSVACCNTKTASALAGLTLLRSLTNQRFALGGGNVSIVKALKSEISAQHPGACLTNIFVWSITIQDSGALVTYSDAAGEYHTILARHVAITAPPMVASRLITNMNDLSRMPLLKLRYGSYLVGNVQLRSPIFHFGYQGYTNQSTGIAEIDVFETAGKLPINRLTLKQPFEQGSEGRTLLLEGNKEALAQSLINQSQVCAPDQPIEVQSITLSRWGHAIAAPLPDYYSSISKIAATQLPCVSFCHSSTAGIQSLDTAVEAAWRTANRALGKAEKRSISFSI